MSSTGIATRTQNILTFYVVAFVMPTWGITPAFILRDFVAIFWITTTTVRMLPLLILATCTKHGRIAI
jgi:hypothetical protein